MKTLNPITVLRRLRNDSKQLQKMLTNGKFNQLSHKKRQQWLTRVERFKQQLSKFGHFQQVRKIVAGATLVLGLAFGNTATAQTSANFTPVQTNPFGLTATGSDINFMSVGDLDDDGDFDVISGMLYGGIKYFENQGDSVLPAFTEITVNSPFANTVGYYFNMPNLVDIDNDGDLDLFVTQYYGETIYYENIGTPTTPSFTTVQTQPFGLNTLNLAPFIHHTFVDIDGDMDLDIVAGSYYGNVYYFQNTGTQQNAAFAAPVTNPFGMTALSADYALTSFSDIDNDGDLDMFVGSDYGNIAYYENTGSATNPTFGTSQNNPFNLDFNNSNVGLIAPIFVDIDDDGDDDVFGGNYGLNGSFLFQEQGPPNNVPMSADTSITINQDEIFVFDASNFPFSDVDVNDVLASVKIKSLTNAGQFTYTGLNLIIDYEAPANDLSNMVYQPNAGLYGQNFDSFQFEVSDGIDYSGIYTFTFNVNALPSTTQTTVTTIENTDYVFNTADFAFIDPDGGTFDNIQILTLPSKGLINYNGSPVASGQVIATSDFANLTFSPDLNETGFPYTDFLFAVGDGTGFSQPAAMYIDVDFPISTKGINSFATIQLTPNPASETARIRIETAVSKSATLSVQNIAGQVVLNENIELNGDFNASIDVSNWAKGLYIIRLQTIDGETWTEKLIIQ